MEIRTGENKFHLPPVSLLNSNCGPSNCISPRKCTLRHRSCALGARKIAIVAMCRNGCLKNGTLTQIRTLVHPRLTAGFPITVFGFLVEVEAPSRSIETCSRAMKTLKVTLIATLIGTAVGLGAWAFGLGQIIWPAHPQMASFFPTLVTTIVIQITWPSQ